MNLSAEQYYALEQMGIPVWDQRQDANIAQHTTETNEANNLDTAKPWLVLIDKPLSAAEERLLRAIFASINVQLDDIAILDKQQFTLLDRFSADKTIGLVLGEALSDKLKLKSHKSFPCQQLETKLLVLVAPSLKQLIEQPQLKPDMWQLIQLLRNLKVQQID